MEVTRDNLGRFILKMKLRQSQGLIKHLSGCRTHEQRVHEVHSYLRANTRLRNLVNKLGLTEDALTSIIENGH